jgi:hypothetical protein
VPENKTLVMTVKDRLLISEFFPERGNLITKVIEKDISEKLTIGQEEAKLIGLIAKPGGGGVTWTQDNSKDKEYSFTEAEISYLKDQVERIDKAGQFNADTASVAQKIKSL